MSHVLNAENLGNIEKFLEFFAVLFGSLKKVRTDSERRNLYADTVAFGFKSLGCILPISTVVLREINEIDKFYGVKAESLSFRN